MNAARQISYLVDEEKHVLRALLYFDIFDYPLTASEVTKFSMVATHSTAQSVLDKLAEAKIIYRFGDFYSLQDKADLLQRRVDGNRLAEKKMKTARRFSNFIARIPFVRAVMLSGSISKGYMDVNSDIDYFIIASPNRLWIVRSVLALFRRIFLLNSHENLCTNYFIDEHNLEIRDHNIFTAIELCTTVPMAGQDSIARFHASNSWTHSFLPNFSSPPDIVADPKTTVRNMFEKITISSWADRINTWLMMKTLAHWKKKYGRSMEARDFDIAFRSTAGVSRSHPRFFQKKVLGRFEEKIKAFDTQKGIDLSL